MWQSKCGQGGSAVLMCLMMLILVMLLGVSAAQLSLQGEQVARGERDHEVAFQAAEDSLADAERDIVMGTASTDLTPACSAAPVWLRVDLSGVDDGGVCTLAYGAHTGAVLPTGAAGLPLRKPRYLIETMVCHQPGEDASAKGAEGRCYRVTALGFGVREGTEVVLQSVFSTSE